MAREPVVKIVCDRCGREEFLPVADDKGPADLEICFKGESVCYDDLCTGCESTCRNLFENMTKALKHVSPKRKAKKEGSEEPSNTTEPLMPGLSASQSS